MKSYLALTMCWAVVLGVSGAQARGLDCLGSLRADFAGSGYSPDIDCHGDKLVVKNKYLGELRIDRKRYRIYQTRFHFNTIPTNTHWGERLFVFDSKRRYLGEYAISGFYNQFHIVGHALIADMPVKDNKIIFTAKGPPEAAILDGEPIGFYR